MVMLRSAVPKIALVAILAMIGCAHERTMPRKGASEGTSTVLYAVEPFGKYVVNEKHRYDDLQGVVKFLEQHGSKAVVFKSEIKMTPGDACEGYTTIERAGFKVLEFWIPAAFTPGGVDLVKISGGPCG